MCGYFNDYNNFGDGRDMGQINFNGDTLKSTREILNGKDCRSALFTFSCLHSTGMIGLSFFKHPIGKASSYILVKVVTDLAKIPTGIWTTKCAEGYMKHKNETTKNNDLTVAIIVASGLGMQKLLGPFWWESQITKIQQPYLIGN